MNGEEKSRLNKPNNNDDDDHDDNDNGDNGDDRLHQDVIQLLCKQTPMTS